MIKHGIKMSAMRARGYRLDDAEIWNFVAFLQKMPELTPAQYQQMVAKSRADHDHNRPMKSDEHGPAADGAGGTADPSPATTTESLRQLRANLVAVDGDR